MCDVISKGFLLTETQTDGVWERQLRPTLGENNAIPMRDASARAMRDDQINYITRLDSCVVTNFFILIENLGLLPKRNK